MHNNVHAKNISVNDQCKRSLCTIRPSEKCKGHTEIAPYIKCERYLAHRQHQKALTSYIKRYLHSIRSFIPWIKHISELNSKGHII